MFEFHSVLIRTWKVASNYSQLLSNESYTFGHIYIITVLLTVDSLYLNIPRTKLALFPTERMANFIIFAYKT
jgi:hypothetical protein